MIGTKKTVKDYMELPEGAPYQLIEGELVMSPAPGYSHQNTLGNLFIILRTRLKDAQVILSPIDVYLDEENAYQPDLVVVLKDSKAKVEERGIFGAPDVVVEILSPSTAYYDLTEKKDVYERVGVKEYWIVDPKEKPLKYTQTQRKGLNSLLRLKKMEKSGPSFLA